MTMPRLPRLAPLAVALLLAAAPAAAQRPWHAAADSVALHAPAEAAATVASLAAHLTAGLPGEREKARAIYRWMTENVEYDAAAYFRGRMLVPNQDPASILRRRRAICEGYGLLFVALAREAGLQAEYVSGRAQLISGATGERFGADHGWNAVRIDGEWKLVDATFGAGDLVGREFRKRFRDFYFEAPPEKLVFSHYPDDRRWQLLPSAVSRGDFERRAQLTRDFWELGFAPDSVLAAMRTRGFPGLVETFTIPGHAVAVQQAPMVRRLAAGTAHPLRIHAPGAVSVTAVSGDVWQPLADAGGTWAGEARMAADEMIVMVAYPDTPQPVIILKYTKD
jgi:hypothetical protein